MYTQYSKCGNYRKEGHSLFKKQTDQFGQDSFVHVSTYARMPRGIEDAIAEHEEYEMQEKRKSEGACERCGADGMGIYAQCAVCGHQP